MRPPLTEKQHKLFEYLKQETRETGMAPSLRTTAAELDISHTAVAQTLKTLEEKKYIRRQGRYSRTIGPDQPHNPSIADRKTQIG